MEKCPVLKVNEWVVLTEDGLWTMLGNFTFKSKKEAIWDVSVATLDTRKTPKVEREYLGSYLYTPKDVDTGKFGEVYIIRKLTDENIEYFQTMLQDQWDDDVIYREGE